MTLALGPGISASTVVLAAASSCQLHAQALRRLTAGLSCERAWKGGQQEQAAFGDSNSSGSARRLLSGGHTCTAVLSSCDV